MNGGVLRCTCRRDAKGKRKQVFQTWEKGGNRDGYENIDAPIATILSSRRPQAWQLRSVRVAWCAETVVALADT